MSGFLTNLAARARGTMSRLEPRKPAPYEALADRPMASDLDSELSFSVPPTGLHPDLSSAAVSRPLSVPKPVASHPASLTSGPETQATEAPAQPMRRATAISPTVVSLLSSMSQASPPTTPLVNTAVVRTPPLPTVQIPASRADNRLSSAKTNAMAHRVSPQPAAPITVPTPAALIPAIALTTEPVTPPSDIRQPQRSEASKMLPDSSDTKPTSTKITHPEISPSQPLLPKEALALHPTRSATNRLDDLRAREAPEAPQIEVHIGTIEVVTDASAAPLPQPVMVPSRSISLDDFLDGGG